MIGKVIEGRYTGASVNKLPDRNILFIQTNDGKRISLSKNNAISIEDVTAQYPQIGNKVIMVMWNDFEVSVIQLGVSNASDSTEMSNANPHDENKRNMHLNARTNPQRPSKRKLAIAIIPIICILFCVLGGIHHINRTNLQNQKINNAKALAHEKVMDVIVGVFDTNDYNYLNESDFAAILDSINVSYSEPVIKGNSYSLTATYRYGLSDKYSFVEFEIAGDFDSDSFNVRYIRDYQSDYSIVPDNGDNSPSLDEPEIVFPEAYDESQYDNVNITADGLVSIVNNGNILNENDIFVEFRGIEIGPTTSERSYILNFYVENKSDIDLYLQLYGERINGYTMEISNGGNLIPAGGKYLALPNFHFVILESELSAYGIDSIADLDFNLVLGIHQYVFTDDILYDVPVHVDIE